MSQRQSYLAAQGASSKEMMEIFASKPIKNTNGQQTWTEEGNPRLPTFGKELTPRIQMQQTPENVATVDASIRGQDIGAETALAGQGVTMRGQNMTAATALAGQGVTMRGQDMRKATGANMSAPVAIVGPDGKPIYTTREGSIGQTPAASMEGLTPKEIQKREAAFPQSQASFKSIENSGRSLIADMTALRDHPGLASITGIAAGA